MKTSKQKHAAVIDGSMVQFIACNCQHIPNFLSDKEKYQQCFEDMIRRVQKFLTKQNYDFVVFVLDGCGSNFRRVTLPEYKERDVAAWPKKIKIEDRLCNVSGLWKECIVPFQKELKIPIVVAQEPYEGDDVIGTIAKQFEDQKILVDVWSRDHDFHQLISDWISVCWLGEGGEFVIFNNENFQTKQDGLLPEQVPFFKALSGDQSDRYSGLPGIGKKFALKIISQFPKVEDFWKVVDLGDLSSLDLSDRLKTNILENKDRFLKCLEAAKIVKDINLGNDLQDYKFMPDDNSERNLFFFYESKK